MKRHNRDMTADRWRYQETLGGEEGNKGTKDMKTRKEMKRQHWHVRQGKIMKRLEGREIVKKKTRKRRKKISNSNKDKRLEVQV